MRNKKYLRAACYGAVGMLMPMLAQAQTDIWSVKSLQQTLDKVYDDMIPLSGQLLGVGRGLAGFAALFYIGNKVWKNMAQGEPVDVYPLLRPFAIGLLIMFYPLFIDTVNSLLKPITEATQTMVDDENKAIAVALAAKEKALQGNDEWKMYVGLNGEGNKDEWYRYTFHDNPANQDFIDKAVTDIAFSVRQSMYNMKNKMRAWVAEILNVLYEAAALCIDTIRIFYMIVLVILGPLALAFSVFDGFTHTLANWLGRYMHVYLWLPVCNIFAAILAKIQENMILLDTAQLHASGVTAFGPTDIAYLIFLIIGIVGYTTVPNVTHYIIQATGSHSALQKVTNIVAIAARTGGAHAVKTAVNDYNGFKSGGNTSGGSPNQRGAAGGQSNGAASNSNYQQNKIKG